MTSSKICRDVIAKVLQRQVTWSILNFVAFITEMEVFVVVFM